MSKADLEMTIAFLRTVLKMLRERKNDQAIELLEDFLESLTE